MRKVLFFITILFLPLLAVAQELKVSSFEAASFDLSASTKPRVDLNKTPCALVKVGLTIQGATFAGGIIGDVTRDGSDYWVYMPVGTKMLQVKHPNYETLMVNFPELGVAQLQSKVTYILRLEVPQTASGQNQPVFTQQYVVFEVEPKDAVVELDGEVLEVNEGMATKRKSFGTYSYAISSLLYHDKSGEINVNDPQNKHVVKVKLDPAFGYLEVPATDNLKDAKVYVDDKQVGTTPYRSDRLASGEHKVRVVRPMYTPLTESIAIKDNETTRFAPSLSANFAELTFKVDGNAEIWLNDELKGRGSWSGKLSTGAYKVECRKTNHRSSYRDIDIDPSMTGKSITLESPVPIYGSIDISSTPANATILLDGKEMGATPMLIHQFLVGQHELLLKRDNYSDYQETVTIREGETTVVSVKMDSHAYVDLGLPSGTLWATCNVGASKPEEYGDYFAWGETETKSTYSWSTYKWCKGSDKTMTKYCTSSDYGTVDNKKELDLEDDVAHVKWGGDWRIPTQAQQDELRRTSYITWTWDSTKKGYTVTSKKNGNSIFLPAAGYRNDGTLVDVGSYGSYWSRSLGSSFTYYAYDLYFNLNNFDWYDYGRFSGQSVRPVRSASASE